MTTSPKAPIVSVDELSVAYRSGGREVPVVQEVSLEVSPGRTLALVGESGSGKSTVAATLLGHLRHGSRITGGRVAVDGEDVFALTARELRRLRGGTVAMVAQNAGHALTPSMRIGRQIAEAGGEVPVTDLLEQVRLPNPRELARRYPHELSGGQQQRVAIAMAIAARPKVLVLDEPTTGLDVITQRGVLDLISALREELGLAAVLVSHDLGVVARMADEVCVLNAGRVVEAAPTRRLFAAPADPYTRRLLASVPRIADAGLAVVGEDGTREIRPRADSVGAVDVVDVREVTIDYGASRAVDGVSFSVRRGEVLALVGESGSGKSTIAWSLAGLREPSGGTMRAACGGGGSGGSVGGSSGGSSGDGSGVPPGGSSGDGSGGPSGGLPGGSSGRDGDLGAPARRRPLALRRTVQLVFQNADTSLNPRRSVGDAVRRPLRFFGTAGSRGEAASRARQLIADVRLDPDFADRLPAQLSGGQRQRIGIARALAGEPDLLIADEITTALDVSVQADVLRLLDDLRRERELACLFISHDLAVVRGIADRVVVLRHGVVVEEGPTDAVFAAPGHPYTRQLIAAALEPDPDAEAVVEAADAWQDGAEPDGVWDDLGGGHRVRRWRSADA
ncbi:ATP-binding cassette domain-containing protein [Streptomyces rapamycinicus]|uniref:Peptide ABC transporter ATP-binding protein n=2 Tax=Streptomyces rapamycinicus TaxID=1226757 RepID=A0A0A0NLV6_STRRN|nr:ABC transporter ATP-binding protein [Streptomyces rapamycinicus]AGP55360.1 peptide ABC transporter ATP-binding protein [Streptomyces rapamycinicus NRRL 5491]MBB4782914.1 peptide/nickel transport system ATP-binding protein [Streptomyces rapamycinicus]RLV81606.1 peptide ABC transporter ATP-binding protein [Streptomyces rapamycinicus NRRL 5491]UTO63377.1 ABC transporter ATP-binding protein [Streptomyces rapamycinicus]UTP31335.1 ABC transporter ATP-binding protein [Streptomyces rapamycinicus NR